MRKFKEWTEADTITLDRLMKQRCSNKMIAKMLGRSESYISLKKKELGYKIKPSKHWTKEEIRFLKCKLEEGEIIENITEDLHRPILGVKAKVKELGLNRVSISWEEKYLCNYFISLLKKSRSLSEAIDLCGLTRKTIFYRLKYCKDEKKIISQNEYDFLLNKLRRESKVVTLQ